MNADTKWRGFALNEQLLARSFLPLFMPWKNVVALYRFRWTPGMSDFELQNFWRERDAIAEYLRGLT